MPETTTTTTHPLYRLPLGERDRAYLQKTLDRLWDDPVSDYDLAAKIIAHPYGLNVYRQWESARTTPLVRYADHRPAKTLEEFGTFDPIPSRQQVLDALEEAALAWEGELL